MGKSVALGDPLAIGVYGVWPGVSWLNIEQPGVIPLTPK